MERLIPPDDPPLLRFLRYHSQSCDLDLDYEQVEGVIRTIISEPSERQNHPF